MCGKRGSGYYNYVDSVVYLTIPTQDITLVSANIPDNSLAICSALSQLCHHKENSGANLWCNYKFTVLFLYLYTVTFTSIDT